MVSQGATAQKSFLNIFEIFVLIVWLICLNASALIEYDQFPALDAISSRGWQIAMMNLGLIFLVVVLVRLNHLYNDLFASWSNNRWLVVFLVLSFASLAWSVYLKATVYELILLVSSTFCASYFAVRFRLAGVISILTWFAAVCTLASLFIVFFTPNGIMHGSGHLDSWRGLFWHRNHAGSLMAFFNMIFLARLFMDKRLNGQEKFVHVIFYILTAIHVFGSRSATGKILFFTLNLASLLAFLWVEWRSRIKPWHYYGLAIILLGATCFIVANVEVLLGLLGRSTTLTGRTMMWPDLFHNSYMSRPLLGHGFGTIWMQESFRNTVQSRWAWGYQPYFSDNGYLDLLLNLGAAGLVVFLFGMIQVAVHVIQRLGAGGSWMYLFALITLFYVFMANLAYSFLFEVDYFVWSLLVLMAFLASQAEPGHDHRQPSLAPVA